MKYFQHLVSAAVITSALFLSLVIVVRAESLSDIKFPVPELGNCQNKEECKVYCDDISHAEECMSFALSHGLVSEEEARHVRKFASSGGEGPGGCRTKDACRSYCEDIGRIDECLAFAENHGLIEEEEIEEARKISSYIRAGGRMPGDCANERECKTYCDAPGHIDECLTFAERAGFIPEDEIKNARAFMEAMQRGETPGGCREERECREYCDSEEHGLECVEFAVKSGAIPPEEAEFARTIMREGGPGGCRGRECEEFCNNPEHFEECFEFAKSHELIDRQEIERRENDIRRFKDELGAAPENVTNCLNEKLGVNLAENLRSGKVLPGPQIGDDVRACFEKFMFEGGGEPGERHSVGDFMENAPPEVLACAREKAGHLFEAIERGKISEVAELEKVIRVCFEEFNQNNPQPGAGPRSDEFRPEFDNFDREKRPGFGDDASNFSPNFSGTPFSIKDCLNRELGPDFEKRAASGELAPSLIRDVAERCSQSQNTPSEFELRFENKDAEFRSEFDGAEGEFRIEFEAEGDQIPNPEDFRGEFEGAFPERFEGDEFREEFKEEFDGTGSSQGASAFEAFIQRWRARVGR